MHNLQTVKVSPPFVGRRAPLASIASAWNASRGAPQWVEVRGQPGVGKTRLLTEATERIRTKGGAVHWGRATEFEQDAPLALLADTLDGRMAENPRWVSSRLSEEEHRLLSAVFPALSTVDEATHAALTAGAGTSRYRLFRAVRSLLGILSGDHGLVLLLDDVHWADTASIDLLGYLTQHPPAGRILFAIAYRPAQAPVRLTAALARLTGGRRLIEVEPLSTDEVDELLGPDPTPAHRRWLHEAAGGNPFYLEALARLGEASVREADEIGESLPEETMREVPAAVRLALRLELDRLSPEADLVARAAAVVGDEFDATTVAAAAGLDTARVLAAFDDLATRDIVRVGPASGRFRFRHPLVRHAAYAASPPGWRVATHGRVATLLASVGAPSTVQAPHLVRSACPGDQHAVRVLADAAVEVAPRAPAVAGQWLRTALELLPDTPATIGKRLGLLTKLTQALAVSGQLVAGRDTARDALRRLEPDHPCRREVVRTCAVLERLLDQPANARGVLLAELQHLADPTGVDAFALRVRLAVEDLWAGEIREAEATLDWAGDLVARHADRSTEFAIAALRPVPAYAAGRMDLACAYAARAGQLMDSATDQELAPWLDGAAWFCWAELLLGHYEDCLHRLGRTLAIARDTRQSYIVSPLLNLHVRTLGRLGRLPEALAYADEAVELARLQDFQQALAIALGHQTILLSWMGDYRAALDAGRRAAELGRTIRQWWGAAARSAIALPLIYTGEVDRGHEVMSAACEEYEAMGLDQTQHLSFCEVMADAEAARGGTARAETWATRAARTAHPDLPTHQAQLQLVRAHARCGPDPAAAADLATRAAETFAALDLRLDTGRARLRAGTAHALAGNRRQALADLTASASLFTECGARGLLAQANREQRRLGIRIPAPSTHQDSPMGLSAREIEVARLVIDGCTNQQIADRLYLSIRTVETHMSRIFAKLEVSSRVGVSRVLTPLLAPTD